MKKICSINNGEFEFPLDYFGETSSINNSFSQFSNYSAILNITTELSSEEDLAEVNGDYMSFMNPITNLEISSITISSVEALEDGSSKVIPIASFEKYHIILDLGTDCPPVENLYRGTIRFGAI